jgi:hypothetical protein
MTSTETLAPSIEAVHTELYVKGLGTTAMEALLLDGSNQEQQIIVPASDRYRELDIEEGFNWPEITKRTVERYGLGSDKLYLVVFRSNLRDDADKSAIAYHDKKALEAAMESPDCLYYFAGHPDASGRALSFCLWKNEDAAKEASRDKRHSDAMKMVSYYNSYTLERRYIDPTNIEDPLVLVNTNTPAGHS